MTHARPLCRTPGRLLWLPVAACALWLFLTAGLYRQALHAETTHRLELERIRLATVARQLLDVRNWNAAHGGVYVRQSPYGPPNPWLPEGERTLATADGRTLVLMNPAYMSRQLAERTAEPGLSISIVSPRPLRPENLADAWENGALLQCAEGPREIFTPPQADAQGRLRLLSVLTARPDCLRCHQGSKEGEILGGISVSQDAAAYLSGLRAQTRHMRLLYGLLGLTGMLGIGGATLYLTRRRWLAEETSRLKGDLLARLGHDMRTPLTAMLGMTELLRRPELRPPEKARALNYLAQAGGALLEMVGDITDHAALERAAPALRVAPFGLRACLGECLALYRPVAEAKGLFLRLNVPDDVPDAVTGDGFRLRQALGNLVSNAVKFTEQGGVRVDVRARPGGRKDRDLRCSLAVTDTGPGLRPEEQERVFASFQRGEAAASCPGTGLGLGMARRLARRMGGDVSLRSRPGEGACFTLEIHLRTAEEQDAGGRPSAPPVPQTLTDPAPRPPMAAEADLASPRPPGAAPSAPVAAHCADAAAPAANAPDSPADAPPAATAALNGLRVLLAEDNPATAYYLQHMLTRAGAATRLLADGEAALALLRDAAQGPWDILLLDACLPGRSGLEVLEAVRAGQTAAPQDQKILLCTASPAMTEAPEARRRAALADGLLRKPCSFAALHRALAALRSPAAPLSAAAARSEADAPGTKAPCALLPDAAPPVWDRKAALEAVDNDPALLSRLAAVAAQDLRARADALAALPPKPTALPELRRLAHACKNTAGSLCLGPLRRAAAALEQARAEDAPAARAALAAALREALETLGGDAWPAS
ncbi:hypothetical protein SAMN05192586_11519 [Desulfovibrio legallii]|uniref:histidine kinase n=2 Tax=Desulfovibrio legallii TaxID=571438 RepID=A0A1G7PB00_9BACT|nr:hypothetical protein SAMN05192586_11519 [Desulfovibrio legallii]